VYALLQWDHDTGNMFDVLRVEQDGDVVSKVVNNMSNIQVDSDLSSAAVYESDTFVGDPILLEFRIDSSARGSGNQEITTGPVASSPTSVSNGDTEIILNPDDRNINLKLFELLIYNEDIGKDGSRGPDRVGSYESYFYNIDMTFDTKNVVDAGRGSPDIANHLFFEEDKFENNVYVAGDTGVVKLNPNGSEETAATLTDGGVVRTDSQGFLYVIDDTETRKHAPDLTPIWTVSKSASTLAVDQRGFTYIGESVCDPEGNVVLDIFNDTDLSGMMTPSSDIVTGKNRTAYYAGEFSINGSGNYAVVKVDVEEQEATGIITETDLDCDTSVSGDCVPKITVGLDGALYVLQDSVLRKFVEDGGSYTEEWAFDGAIGSGAVEVDQNNNVLVDSNSTGIVKINQTPTGPVVEWTASASSIMSVEDIAIDPKGNYYILGDGNVEKVEQPSNAPIVRWNFSDTRINGSTQFDVDPGRITSQWE